MMLPGNRPSMPPTPVVPPAPSSASASTAASNNNLAHADYNHLPLEVRGLDHYVKRDADERFHVR